MAKPARLAAVELSQHCPPPSGPPRPLLPPPHTAGERTRPRPPPQHAGFSPFVRQEQGGAAAVARRLVGIHPVLRRIRPPGLRLAAALPRLGANELLRRRSVVVVEDARGGAGAAPPPDLLLSPLSGEAGDRAALPSRLAAPVREKIP
jgi:hypothetical protein